MEEATDSIANLAIAQSTTVDSDLTPGSDQIPDLETVAMDDQGNVTATKVEVITTKTQMLPEAAKLPASIKSLDDEPWQTGKQERRHMKKLHHATNKA